MASVVDVTSQAYDNQIHMRFIQIVHELNLTDSFFSTIKSQSNILVKLEAGDKQDARFILLALHNMANVNKCDANCFLNVFNKISGTFLILRIQNDVIKSILTVFSIISGPNENCQCRNLKLHVK